MLFSNFRGNFSAMGNFVSRFPTIMTSNDNFLAYSPRVIWASYREKKKKFSLMQKLSTRWCTMSKTFLAMVMSLEEGATIVGENRNVHFSSPANTSLRRCN